MKGKTKILLILGLIGSILTFLRLILVLIDPWIFFGEDRDVVNMIFLVPSLMQIIGYFGISTSMYRFKRVVQIFLGLDLIYGILILLDEMDIDEDFMGLIRIIFIIALLPLFSNFWKDNKLPLILFILQVIRIINILLELEIGIYVSILYNLLLIIWFNSIRSNPDLSGDLSTTPKTTTKSISNKGATKSSSRATTASKGTTKTTSTPISKSNTKIKDPQASSGRMQDYSKSNFPPQLVFWCPKCKNQKKGVSIDFSNDQTFQQKRKCSSCGSYILQYWAPMSKKQEGKMILGVSFFAGAMITNIIGVMLGLSVLGWILAVVSIIFGTIIALTTLNSIKKIKSPPSYASEVPALAPLKQQLKIIGNFALRMGLGAILVMIVIFIIG
ncbi:MAG: hypothetical protein INQ03_12415 [Candidatus Heimdallarchaeota archaeon]|nr:hypothetical protein [Candidatus Heimdallarchaeota archaeon]